MTNIIVTTSRSNAPPSASMEVVQTCTPRINKTAIVAMAVRIAPLATFQACQRGHAPQQAQPAAGHARDEGNAFHRRSGLLHSQAQTSQDDPEANQNPRHLVAHKSDDSLHGMQFGSSDGGPTIQVASGKTLSQTLSSCARKITA